MISSQFLNDCLAGSEEAIQQLIRTYQRQIYQLVLSVIDHSDAPIDQAMLQAEIATRETFVIALDTLGRYREDTPFAIWLFRIAVRVARKRARLWQRSRWWSERPGILWRAFRRVSGQKENAPSEAMIYQQIEPQQPKRTGDGLWKSLRQLDEKLRLPVVLRYYHDFSLEEIAGILKVSEGTVHARLDKAREQLAFQTPTVTLEPD